MSGDSVPWVLPLARFQTSDREATTLFRELRKPLLRYLVCLGLSSDEAQDVVQDAFLSLHCHLSAGGSQENIRSWLFRVAHNQARNRQNSYHRRFSAPLDEGFEAALEEATPETVLLDKEKFQRLGMRFERWPLPSVNACCCARAGCGIARSAKCWELRRPPWPISWSAPSRN